MEYINLNGKWQGTCVGEFDFSATVPGCTITDLIDNGYLPKDLLCGKNADAVQAYENCDWIYRKNFILNKVSSQCILSFLRLDTYADVYVNGRFVAHTENGNIAHNFDVTDQLVSGENTVEVRFTSPITSVEKFPLYKGHFTTERLNTRRQQCTYGWDWVARFVCCGIEGAELLCYDEEETVVKSVYVFTEEVKNGKAFVQIETEFKKEIKKPVSLEILDKNGNSVYKKSLTCGREKTLLAEIENAQLWYPVGYGAQPLYTVKITDETGVLYEEKFGIRTVEILEIPDEKGSQNYEKCLKIQNEEYDFNKEFSSFTLVVNGIKIMCKGANWVPCQPYVMDGKEEKITEILQLSVEMGLNMLRVWGGGAFECKHFYNECSRLGILVTQDFLMACGHYPEKQQWFLEHLQKEAEYACLFMRNQPCLVWYSGDNENAVEGSFDDEDYIGKTAFEKGLKPVVDRLDRTRVFLASSPYGGNKFASNTVGTTHNTQFLGEFFDYIDGSETLPNYKEKLKTRRARFIAEEPIFGAISLSSLRKFMKDEEIFAKDKDMWLYHSKGNPALKRELMDYMWDFTEKVLGKFKNPYDRYFKLKYFEYEWLRVVMEQARREKWFCSGMIFWMLNDCWTAASGWSLIDYYNKPKLAYYAFKRCAQPVLCSLDYEDGKYWVSVSNDALTDCNGDVKIFKIKNGTCEQVDSFALTCPANDNSSKILNVDLLDDEFLIAELTSSINGCRAFYKHGGMNLEKVENAVEYVVENGAVILTAKQYVQAVEIEGEAIFEDNGFSMLAGEKRVVPFRYMNGASNKSIQVETYTLA